MELRDFLSSMTPAERQAFANRADTAVGYLYQLAGGHRRPSADMAVRLENASGRRVTREELLPEFFVRAPVAGQDTEAAA